jgi:hypothetical protein
MPLSNPSSGTTLDIIDRLAAYIAADSTVNALFTTPVKTYPMNGINPADGVTVSLHCPDEDYNVQTIGISGKMRVSPRLILTVCVYEAENNADVQANYRKLVSLTTALRDSIYRKNRDSNATPYWYRIDFPRAGGNAPTSVYKHEPNRHHISFTQFTVVTQKAKPT